jgi:hypothetical protein
VQAIDCISIWISSEKCCCGCKLAGLDFAKMGDAKSSWPELLGAPSEAAKQKNLRMCSVLEFGGMGRVGSVPRTNSCVRLERRNGTN